MRVSFVLRDPTAERETPIVCHVNYSNSRAKLSTGLSVLPKHWNPDRRRVKRGATGEAVTNAALARMESEIAEIFRELTAERVPPTPDLIRKRYDARNGTAKPAAVPDLFTCYDEYLERSQFRPATVKCHRKAKNHLTEFAKTYRLRLTFDRLDSLFWERFVRYLITVRQMTNDSAWAILKSVRAFLADAHERGLTATDDYRRVTRSTLPKGEASAKPYLSAAELESVRELDLSDSPRLDRVRDLFVFLCYTGIRFGDSQQLRPENRDGDVLRLVLEKNRKHVTIPLLPPAAAILDRYAGELPRLSNQKANEYLSEVLQRARIDAPVHVVSYSGTTRKEATVPKHKACGMHTAKRTFVSLSRQRGVSVEALMRATGNDRSTLERYILRTDADALDEIRGAWGAVGNAESGAAVAPATEAPGTDASGGTFVGGAGPELVAVTPTLSMTPDELLDLGARLW